MKRCRVTSKTPSAELAWATRSYDRAWRSYIRGNVVSDYSARLIGNYLTMMAGTGKLEPEEDEGMMGEYDAKIGAMRASV